MAITFLVSTIFLRPCNVIKRKISSFCVPLNNVQRNIIFKREYLCKPPSIYLNKYVTSKQLKTIKNTDMNPSKVKIIKNLNFLSEEDAIPFYPLPLKSLLQIYKTTKSDEDNGYCKNRLYYISERIQCPPSKLSVLIAKRIFIYKLSFNWLESSLNVLLAMNISGERISRDLWVLKYHHRTIQERLQRVRDLGVENLYPWMVRCSEDILNRFVQITQDTKKILGENKSTTMYLAKRLHTSPVVIEDMCLKIPMLKTIRVIKAKNFLDFLINEGFTIEEIVNKPRIFGASQKTVKHRLEKLRSIGLKEINLNVLCRSRKDFQRYFESIQSISTEEGIDIEK